MYKQKPQVGKNDILPSDTFHTKRTEIVSSVISKIKTN